MSSTSHDTAMIGFIHLCPLPSPWLASRFLTKLVPLQCHGLCWTSLSLGL